MGWEIWTLIKDKIKRILFHFWEQEFVRDLGKKNIRIINQVILQTVFKFTNLLNAIY